QRPDAEPLGVIVDADPVGRDQRQEHRLAGAELRPVRVALALELARVGAVDHEVDLHAVAVIYRPLFPGTFDGLHAADAERMLDRLDVAETDGLEREPAPRAPRGGGALSLPRTARATAVVLDPLQEKQRVVIGE